MNVCVCLYELYECVGIVQCVHDDWRLICVCMWCCYTHAVYACVYMHINMCMYVIYIYIYIYIYACIVYIYMYIYLSCIYICNYTYACVCMNI